MCGACTFGSIYALVRGNMDTTAATLSGTPSTRCWSQAATRLLGGVTSAVVLTLTCETDGDLLDITQVGGELLESVLSTLVGVRDGRELQPTLEPLLTGLGRGVAASILVVCIFDGQLSLWGKGEVGCYLLRDGHFLRLADPETSPRSVSGHVAVGDTILVYTTSLVNACDLIDIRRALGEGTEGLELLTPTVLAAPNSASIAAAMIAVAGRSQEKPVMAMPLFVRREITGQERRVQTYVGLGLVVLLVILVSVGYVQRLKTLRVQGYSALSQRVSGLIADSRQMAANDPTRARTDLSDARTAVEQYLAGKPGVPYTLQAQQLAQNIASAEQSVFQVYPVTLSPFIPLSVVAPQLSTPRMATDGKSDLLFADTTGDIVGISTKDKSKFSYSLQAYGPATSVVGGDTGTFGYTAKGVVTIPPKKTGASVAIQPDELWGDVTMIDTFAGNIYLLDQGNSEIWKYPILDTGFGTRKRWFAAGITPDLSKVVDMRVTGDVWLLTSTGKILKYTRGAPQKFSMAGFPAASVDDSLANPQALDVDGTSIYILEAGASRIDVFQDDGTYVKQYTADDFAKATDIAIADGKMYVLVPSGVEWFGL